MVEVSSLDDLIIHLNAKWPLVPLEYPNTHENIRVVDYDIEGEPKGDPRVGWDRIYVVMKKHAYPSGGEYVLGFTDGPL